MPSESEKIKDAGTSNTTNTANVDEHNGASEDKESMLTLGKQILHAVLLVVLYIWWDLFGLWILPMIFYVVLLILPMPFGHWNLETRMQVRSVVIIYIFALSFPLITLWIFLRCGLIVKTAFCIYVACYLMLDDAPKCGKRFLPALRRRKFWRHFASYFPVKLTRTAELDPARNYLFGYHPHGIISIGALCNFATNATGFNELFPGIDIRLLTLAMNFKVPLFRELLLGLGINEAGADSCRRNLTRGPGASIMLVVGGARESLSTKPGHLDVVLENRKGFVKMALKTGASLVPVISFGENDIYGIYHNDSMFKWQLKMQKKLGFAVPMFFGKALAGGLLHRVFGLNVGVMPLRVPIHSVVGKPIDVEKDTNPSPELIDKVHKQYMDELKRISEEYKESYEKERKEASEQCSQQRSASVQMQKKSFDMSDYHVDDLCMVDR